MRNDWLNAGELLDAIVVVGVALFFPVAVFLAIVGG